jgi:hypothetical protein
MTGSLPAYAPLCIVVALGTTMPGCSAKFSARADAPSQGGSDASTPSGAGRTGSGSDRSNGGAPGGGGAGSGGTSDSGAMNHAGTSNGGVSSGGSPSGAGGTTNTGGAPGSGGTANMGGSPSAGGSLSAGGTVNTGGARSTGGSPGAGGTRSTGGAAGAGGGTYVCSGTTSYLALADKECSTEQDCALVSHVEDCCGTELRMALNQSATTAFEAAEAYCNAGLPKCGCAPTGTFAEDGTMVPVGSALIVGKCDNGFCQSRYQGNTFACGDKTCTDLQYCYINAIIMGATAYSCLPMPADCTTDCTCITTAINCSCGMSQGNVTLACVRS